MVSYCCVKGCNNNSNNKKKDPSASVSFHAFPSNPGLRQKWLRAIGRPNWDPPSHTRICSAHFSCDQIAHENVRTRIIDNAYPIIALPPNSNFEASDVEVCRICLAVDLTMYSLRVGILNTCMETILGFSENIEGLPQFVCYECAACLMKSYSLVERSMVAQATLLDIFAQNGQITKSLVRQEKRNDLKLTSSLQSYKITPSQVFEFKFDDERHFSHLTRTFLSKEENSQSADGKICKTENDFELNNTSNNRNRSYNIEKYNSSIECKVENYINDEQPRNSDDDECNDGDVGESVNACYEDVSMDDEDDRVEDVTVLEPAAEIDEKKFKIKTGRKPKKNSAEPKLREKQKRKSYDGLTPDEVKMQEHFNVVKLSLQEQIDEWQKSVKRGVDRKKYVHECKTCSKMFVHLNSYQSHITGHDPSRGSTECPVCKLRFRSDVYARSHAKYTHGKKFYCKSCPKVFGGVAMAKKHQKWHSGHVYKCGQCAFGSAHASALGVHARRHAGALACALCGRAALSRAGLRAHEARAHAHTAETIGEQTYSCEECKINFASEGARRVHILTSSQHRKKFDFCDPASRDPALATACKTCGAQLPSASELAAHRRTEHPGQLRKAGPNWRLPDDSYPKQCDHCSVSVKNRKEHWTHVRRQHPGERRSYRPVITAVCDTCGKGFQNTTKLRLHELRHRSPTVRCELCPKLFYDKFLLATHLSIHSEARPHRCRTCGRSFKLRGNLERHHRVHTDVASYECALCGKKFKYSTSLNLHVRSVHYKIPPPPRKKRSRAKNATVE